MALMKVGTKIKIEQRKFLGESQSLMNDLDLRFHDIVKDYWQKA